MVVCSRVGVSSACDRARLVESAGSQLLPATARNSGSWHCLRQAESKVRQDFLARSRAGKPASGVRKLKTDAKVKKIAGTCWIRYDCGGL